MNMGALFGGLAIIAACAAVDPLALRPRLSPGLRFSYELFLKRTGCEEASDGIALAAEGERWSAMFEALEHDAHFGSLAIIATFVALDPFALRPWLSPGLPFSIDAII